MLHNEMKSDADCVVVMIKQRYILKNVEDSKVTKFSVNIVKCRKLRYSGRKFTSSHRRHLLTMRKKSWNPYGNEARTGF